MNSFLFYDLETTGLNPAFDQILQFSAVRTDMDLNEQQRYDLRVRLRPDGVISPRAMLTNRIGVRTASRGECEYEAVCRIHGWLNQPGTINLGYNTLGFDDEFLRFSFYRNLLPPYTHQYANGCRRMDLLPMTVIYRLYQPEVLTWPASDGEPTLRLEHLSRANALASGPAHDATVDAAACVALARRLRAVRDVWDYLCDSFDKQLDAGRMARLPAVLTSPSAEHPRALLAGSEFGAANAYQAPVVGLGTSVPYRNQTLWLRLDRDALRDTTLGGVADCPDIVRKKTGEPPLVLPPKPRYWERLSDAQRLAADRNLAWLREHVDVFEALVEYHTRFAWPDIPNLDADAALYQNGFPSRATEQLCRAFHQAPLDQRAALIDRFDDPVTRELALRLLGRNYPEHLAPPQRRHFEEYRQRLGVAADADPPQDFRGRPRTPPPQVRDQATELLAQVAGDSEAADLLAELADDLQRRFGSGR